MGRRKGVGGEKPKRRKKVTVKLIPRKHAGEVTEPWAIMEDLQKREHGHLEGAKIALAWRLGWRADANGVLCLGKCRKRGDLDRELDSFDFVILLNKEAWQGLATEQRRALIDHELCHAQIVIDSDGNPKLDDSDRLVCRIRKHDCEEFKVVVKRHGLWTSDLADIAKAAVNDAGRPLLAEKDTAEARQATEATREGSTAAAEPQNTKEWRRWKTAMLQTYGLPAGKVKLLEEAGMESLGKLIDAMNRLGQEDFWWKSVKGFGEGGYDALTEAITRLRKNRSDFQADAA